MANDFLIFGKIGILIVKGAIAVLTTKGLGSIDAALRPRWRNWQTR